ncbi:MAG: hypothetical protein SWY16_03470 [Cyanobacteriota bacterium]|nr:hypothetical protein [Cyanobacteriota bacterium]
MKLNSTIVLTATLLLSMFGAGLISAIWGFSIGRDALQGVTQPDVRPTNNLLGDREGSRQGEAVQFLQEEEILKQVENIEG